MKQLADYINFSNSFYSGSDPIDSGSDSSLSGSDLCDSGSDLNFLGSDPSDSWSDSCFSGLIGHLGYPVDSDLFAQ